jgi:hypothetical protein
LENGVIDNRTGLITFPQNINNGYIQGIYPARRVNAGDKFRTIVNCERGSTSCYVVFRLDYALTGSSNIQTFWAFVERHESNGQYYSADIDLSPLVGQDVKFILSVSSTGSPAGDRALWVAPIIYNAAGGGTAPTATPTPTNTSAPATATHTPTPTNTVAAPTATQTPTPTPTATGIVIPTTTSTSTPTPTATPQ